MKVMEIGEKSRWPRNACMCSAGLLLALAVSSACRRRAPVQQFRSYSGIFLGATAEISVYGADEKNSRAVADAVFAEWGRLDGEYSFNNAYSLISYINRKAPFDWVPVTEECYGLLEKSREYFRMTGGRFDVTFAPLWELWKKSARENVLPDKKDIDAALSQVGFDAVSLDPARRAVRFLKPVQINISGVVRNYALLRAKGVLDGLAVKPESVLVELGGDILAYGRRRPRWEIELRHPLKPAVMLGTLAFDEGAVLVSESHEHFVEIAGKRYCHILDLKTGYPIKDFAKLTIYVPSIDGSHFPSAVAVLMGREAGLAAVSAIYGAMALWADPEGKVFSAAHPSCPANWTPSK